MGRFLDPPAAKPMLPEDKIDKTYKSMRLKVFLGAFVGYAAYYLVRKNLSLAAPGMIDEGLMTTTGVGVAGMGISIAYAFSKFIMGSVSDRSDARKFLTFGLVLAAAVMIVAGLLPYSPATQGLNVVMMFVMMLAVGWISGMGWPPCGRVMVYWFSQNERSFKMSIWNTSHTFGSGTLGLLVTAGVFIFGSIGIEQTWRAAFIFPAIVAMLLAIFCWWAMRDTPQSVGLPPVDEWRKDFSGVKSKKGEEQKIPFKTLFIDYIFKNKLLWMVALANVFVYLVRYGVGSWAPTYLQHMDIMTPEQSNLAFAIHNYAGIPGTIICGWISAKFFKGRTAPPNVIYMILVLAGVLLYWQAGAAGEAMASAFGGDVAAMTRGMVYTGLIIIGFCIYGPVALIGIQAVNLVPKNAAGTAAGFVGLAGYLLGDALLANFAMGKMADSGWGWDATFWLLAVGSVLAAILCATTWKREKQLVTGS